MDYQVKVDGLSFSYEYKRILENINIAVDKGSFISIVGPNGSGKSTLLRNISNVLKPDKGTVLLEGNSISAMNKKEVARTLSFVPQNTSLEFDYKVMDVVLMGRYPYISKLTGETQEDKEIAVKAMTYTNTLHLAQRSFMELSGGERQRVILAQALTQEPRVILLDEPVSHLDLQHQTEILNLIKKMCIDNDLTVIAVLHDLNMAATYSDYIIMMKDGEVRHQGTPGEVLTVESIKEIFNTDVHISLSPIGNKPYIYAFTKPFIKKRNLRVHIICGGGSGIDIINRLYQEGFDISCGVLSIGDLDWKAAKECEASISEEIPFTGISDEAYERNRALVESADFVILAEAYFGRANIRNLELLLGQEAAGKPIFIIGDEGFADRDFTGGQAQKLYERLKQGSNIQLTDKNDLCSQIIKAGNEYEKQ